MLDPWWKRAGRAAGSALRRNVDVRDLIGLAGLLLVGIGLALVWLPAALVVPGAILIYVAIFGVKADGHSRED